MEILQTYTPPQKSLKSVLRTIQTPDFKTELVRDEEFRSMGIEISRAIQKLLAGVEPGQQIASITVRWDNIPDRVLNPDSDSGHWSVFGIINQ